MKEYVPAGKIVNTHGIAGEVRVEVWLDSPAFMKKFKRVFLGSALEPYKVLSAREQKGCLLMKLEGITDLNAAILLKNREIFIARADAKLPKGSYFQCDILNAKVVDESGNMIGVLKEIMETPAQPVYVVQGETEHLIPAVPEFVLSAEFPENGDAVLTVRLIPGM